jgi:hypothetical protein
MLQTAGKELDGYAAKIRREEREDGVTLYRANL